MLNFKMGALAQWKPVPVGTLVAFNLPSTGFRAVKFEVMADRDVAVHALTEDGEVSHCVAVGKGHMHVTFTTSEPVALTVVGDADSTVHFKTAAASQVAMPTGEASFTSIEPRNTGQSDEIKRMMHIMHLNSRQRENRLMDEIKSLRSKPVAKAPAPEPVAPAPLIEKEPEPDAE